MVEHRDSTQAFGWVFVEHSCDESFEVVTDGFPLSPVKVKLVLYYILVCDLNVIFVQCTVWDQEW